MSKSWICETLHNAGLRTRIAGSDKQKLPDNWEELVLDILIFLLIKKANKFIIYLFIIKLILFIYALSFSSYNC